MLLLVPLIAWTGLYDAVEEPKNIAAFWAAAVFVCAWLTACAAGFCRFLPKSVLARTASLFSFLMTLAAAWHELPEGIAENTLRWGALTLLLMAFDSAANSRIFEGSAEKTGVPEKAQECESAQTAGGGAEPEAKAEAAPPETEEKAAAMPAAFQEALFIKCVKWLGAAMLIAAFYSLVQRANGLGWHIFGIPIVDPMRWSHANLSLGRTISTFGNPDFFGIWMAAVLPLTTALFFYADGKGKKLFWIAAWTFCLIITVLVKTRAAWLGLGFAAAGWFGVFLFNSPKKELKKILIGASAVLLSVSVFLAFSASFSKHSGEGDNDLTQRVRSLSNLQDTSLQVRLYFWQSALNMAFAHPWTGVGVINQPDYIRADRTLEPVSERRIAKEPTSVHNQYLNVLSTAGWPAFIIYLCLAAFSLNSVRQIKNTPIKAALLASLLSFYSARVFVDNTVSDEILFIFIISAVSALAHPQTEDSPEIPAEALGSDIFKYNPHVRLAALTSSIIIAAVTLSAVFNLCSLRLAEVGLGYVREAQRKQTENPPQLAEAGGCYDEACRCFENAIRFAPSWLQWQYYIELGKTISYIRTLREDPYLIYWRKAVENCESAAALNPRSTYALQILTDVTAQEPMAREQALHQLNKALAMDSRNARLLLLKAQLLIDLGRFDEALRLTYLIDEICQCELNLSLYNRLAALVFLGRRHEAEVCARRLLKQDPDSRKAVEQLLQQNIPEKKAG